MAPTSGRLTVPHSLIASTSDVSLKNDADQGMTSLLHQSLFDDQTILAQGPLDLSMNGQLQPVFDPLLSSDDYLADPDVQVFLRHHMKADMSQPDQTWQQDQQQGYFGQQHHQPSAQYPTPTEQYGSLDYNGFQNGVWNQQELVGQDPQALDNMNQFRLGFGAVQSPQDDMPVSPRETNGLAQYTIPQANATLQAPTPAPAPTLQSMDSQSHGHPNAKVALPRQPVAIPPLSIRTRAGETPRGGAVQSPSSPPTENKPARTSGPVSKEHKIPPRAKPGRKAMDLTDGARQQKRKKQNCESQRKFRDRRAVNFQEAKQDIERMSQQLKDADINYLNLKAERDELEKLLNDAQHVIAHMRNDSMSQ